MSLIWEPIRTAPKRVLFRELLTLFCAFFLAAAITLILWCVGGAW